MSLKTYPYLIVGGGLAGASAVEGIRELDREGEILLIGSERHHPYHRPPLSKKLWTGQKKVEDIFVHDDGFYAQNAVELVLGRSVTSVDVTQKAVADDKGGRYGYGRLLLATGGTPRRLSVPGSDLPGMYYYRYLDDYTGIRERVREGKTAVVIGGGFIGSEIAAALTMHKVGVTMVFPGRAICSRVFPESLSEAIQRNFIARGIRIVHGDAPASFSKSGDRIVTTTKNGERIESDIVVAGIGIVPADGLARDAGIETRNGIVVNEYLQTSQPDVYAAGDNALFPYQALGQKMRVEHWDNALAQGKCAGRNMSGARDPFTYMPYFFSDLFEFGYEAVGEVDAELETFADWQKENDTGVVYYMKDGKVRGAMMCNVWDRVDAARELITKNAPLSTEDLRGAIR